MWGFSSNLIWEGPEGSRCSAGMFHISWIRALSASAVAYGPGSGYRKHSERLPSVKAVRRIEEMKLPVPAA